jgi:hypothetical protein
MRVYQGSCHCGAIRFEVSGELADLEVCNCSICLRTGFLHWYVEPESFRLLSSDDTLETYQFGTCTAKNHFCGVCGVAPFRRARSDPDMVDVNVRCLEGVDLASLEWSDFDGQNWEQAMGQRGG